MAGVRDKIPKINFKWVNIGLAVSALLMIIILIICLATFGWVTNYKPFHDFTEAMLNVDYSKGICIRNSPANACGPCYGVEANCGNDNTTSRYCQAYGRRVDTTGQADGKVTAVQGASEDEWQATDSERRAAKCCATYQWYDSGTCVQKTGWCTQSAGNCGSCDGIWTGGSTPNYYTGCSASQRSEATESFVNSVFDISCDFGLTKVKCSGDVYVSYDGHVVTDPNNGSLDLTSDPKKVGDTMIGLGSVVIVFLFVNLCINIVILINKFSEYHNYMGIAAMVSCFISWIFLMAGWAHYADKKGGIPYGSVSYGASFAFTIIVWLALFAYSFFWLVLWNQIDEPDDNCDDNCDDESQGSQANSGEYHRMA